MSYSVVVKVFWIAFVVGMAVVVDEEDSVLP